MKDAAPVEGPRDILPDAVFSTETAPIRSEETHFNSRPRRNLLLAAATVGVATLVWKRLRSTIEDNSMNNKRVVITGGSRGLGLSLAEQYLRKGARVFLCARNPSELDQASKKFSEYGNNVQVFPCDITKSSEVKQFADKVKSVFDEVDILVNNAGTIEVGPLDSFSFEAIRKVIDVNLMGMIEVTLNFLPMMPEGSRVINITSIGGAVAVPHLLPYTIAKFGALGFSLGLDSELSRRGISVTSVLPGLMRTGSFVHAEFRGNSLKEFDWFALGATLPLISISARTATKQIISAGQRRKRFVVLGPQAKLLRIFYQAFPEMMLGVMRIVIRLLPKMPKTEGQRPISGSRLRQDLPRGGITRLGDKAGDELNETLAS